jgi:hypothetical protein
MDLFEKPKIMYLSVFIVYAIIFYIYYFMTKFERTITVKSEFLKGDTLDNRRLNNYVSDINNKVYKLQNHYLLWHFITTNNISKLEKGNTVKIKGYGIRVGFLGLYPNILYIE